MCRVSTSSRAFFFRWICRIERNQWDYCSRTRIISSGVKIIFVGSSFFGHLVTRSRREGKKESSFGEVDNNERSSFSDPRSYSTYRIQFLWTCKNRGATIFVASARERPVSVEIIVT